MVVDEDTEEDALGDQMRFALLDGEALTFRESSVQLAVKGDAGAAMAMKALQFLYFSTRREVAFVPRFQTTEGGDYELSISVTIARRRDLLYKDKKERLSLVEPVTWQP